MLGKLKSIESNLIITNVSFNKKKVDVSCENNDQNEKKRGLFKPCQNNTIVCKNTTKSINSEHNNKRSRKRLVFRVRLPKIFSPLLTKRP